MIKGKLVNCPHEAPGMFRTVFVPTGKQIRWKTAIIQQDRQYGVMPKELVIGYDLIDDIPILTKKK